MPIALPWVMALIKESAPSDEQATQVFWILHTIRQANQHNMTLTLQKNIEMVLSLLCAVLSKPIPAPAPR